MKESDYVAAQAVTRLRIACDVLREVPFGDMSKEDRREFFRLLDGICALRDKYMMAIPIDEEAKP